VVGSSRDKLEDRGYASASWRDETVTVAMGDGLAKAFSRRSDEHSAGRASSRYETKATSEHAAIATADISARRSRLLVAFDGEVATMRSPLHYRILPRALRVFAPPIGSAHNAARAT
jgi:hypothetical protein